MQSVELCTYLIEKGADVNARDIQDKTALHYAVQEHRLETSQLLLEHGSNPLAKSRYGDDALTTACLKGLLNNNLLLYFNSSFGKNLRKIRYYFSIQIAI